MSDVAADAQAFAGQPAASEAASGVSDSKEARGKGAVVGFISVFALLALQLYDFGRDHHWTLSAASPFVHGILFADQWPKLAILVVQSCAAAAAISVAFTYILVTNNFTTNISNKIIHNVTDAINDKYVASLDALEASVTSLSAVKDDVSNLSAEVAAFKERLADPEHLKQIERFLVYARDRRVADLGGQLEKDDMLFTRLGDEISQAIKEWRESRKSGGG